MKDAQALRTILSAMQETARAIASRPTDIDRHADCVSPSFLRQLNQVLREVNTAVPNADFTMFDEDLRPILSGYPDSAEVLLQIKLASDMLDTKLASTRTEVADDARQVAAQCPLRPSVFIGCSVEGLRVAKVLQVALAHSCRPVIWHQGVFGLSRGTLESLVAQVHSYQYAILVLTPDDLVVTRGQATSVARDNVLFELGLFMGALGREQTFIVCDASVTLPSDLAGITPAKYQLTEPTNLVADLGPVCTQLEIAMGLL